ncbi:SMI1/KNR4 family protein [Streptomyces lasiicapitis]|uniref:SMI1/KNR4 family protein n=1 Tax=Streptomyces lasiicapitis TaxID=1923961 RepID=UPI00365E6966
MDPRLPRLRDKLAAIAANPHRSRSFGEDKHQFRLGPPLSERRVQSFETDHGIGLPSAYRAFLTQLGATGAAPFYGLLPLDQYELFTMGPEPPTNTPRGFTPLEQRQYHDDLFLHIIEAGCSDLVLLGITGPLSGRILTGNSDGFWGPDLSPAADFIAWYELWLDDMAAGRNNRAQELSAPPSHTP